MSHPPGPDAPWPAFPPPTPREQAMLEVSQAVVELYAATGRSDQSVPELAEHAGISERTFYRYFPRKEEAIRPYLWAGMDFTVAVVRDAPDDIPVRDALIASLGTALDVSGGSAISTLLPLFEGDTRLASVWNSVMRDAEDGFADVLADRLGAHHRSVRIRLAASIVVYATCLAVRLAVDGDTRTPRQILTEAFDLLGDGLFTPVPDADRVAPIPVRDTA